MRNILKESYEKRPPRVGLTVGVTLGVIGGLGFFVVVLPILVIIALLVSTADWNGDGVGPVNRALAAMDYKTLPSYDKSAADIETSSDRPWFGSPTTDTSAEIDYANAKVALLARQRLEDAGWKCTALRSVYPVRELAKQELGTEKADSSCDKFGQLPVGIYFSEGATVTVLVSSVNDDPYPEITNADYCDGYGYGDTWPDLYYCSKLYPKYVNEFQDAKDGCPGTIYDPNEHDDDYCNEVARWAEEEAASQPVN